ncbi:MAG: 2-oxoacid:ferredoxin oxidoreductase subunit beta [Bacteroidales bacterium]|jgi:2-oxoglutarate ferredoxin oxidoreductase subunit beta|nr:2-oxoacid:ferredoxin oxidoreductase subunit beta [Bacteroidales bacterium]MBQ3977918.1 2-oxoacid:ferredoxin oxidoreductase subunit beta [Bacteroidales bacterium]MBQ5980512.1 2-oxoacid:ferredoxin oxidoreductase subunit beta [Bacteroidales bacterium]MBQ6184670.1 2-oxoacid:ferredoxin oxidoreductase subunit beta [Bacteroidales bacterium]
MAKYTFKDFKSDQEIRWCPGCGDFSVLAALQRTLPVVCEEKGIDKDKIVVVSGIGCSSRLPYYMDTYGFHSIHGRATAIATGIKVANPDLCVWQVSGDGDALAIGGNHFIHAIRRNIDINLMLFNNRIYGMTKGQYSPTSRLGTVTKTSPYGTVEPPFNPGSLVLGAKGTFFARSIDTELALNQEIMLAASRHHGTAVMEFLTNCMIFNNGSHAEISAKDVKADRTIVLRDGEKMIFGKDRNKGIMLDGWKLKVVTIGEDGVTEDDILTHDSHSDNLGLQTMLAEMRWPEFPVALGVIRQVPAQTYEDEVARQVEEVSAKARIHDMDSLLVSGSTWEQK